MRDVDPLTRRPTAYRYEADHIEAVACHFDAEARSEEEIAKQCAPSIARQHRGAAKAWRQAAAILRATTLLSTSQKGIATPGDP